MAGGTREMRVRPAEARRRRLAGAPPTRGQLWLATGPGRRPLLSRLHHPEMPAALAHAALSGSSRVREHSHGPWRYMVVPALAPTLAGRPSRREGELLSVLAAPGVLVLLAPTADGPAARLAAQLPAVLNLEPVGNSRIAMVERAPVGRALATLLGLAVEDAFAAADGLSAAAHRLEGSAVRTGDGGPVRPATGVLALRRRATAVRAGLATMRDAIGMLRRDPPRGTGARFAIRLRDVEEHLFQAFEQVDAAREQLASALNYQLAASQGKVNEVIKTLTVLATVLTPITVISSIYGMNFFIPETQWRYGYLFALGLMAACAGGLLAYFRKRGWL